MKCTHLDEFLSAEMETIKEHISNHKWYRHIQDDEEAVSSFIQEYGQYMREVYCSSLCSSNKQCNLYSKEPHSNEPINVSLRKFYNYYIKTKYT